MRFFSCWGAWLALGLVCTVPLALFANKIDAASRNTKRFEFNITPHIGKTRWHDFERLSNPAFYLWDVDGAHHVKFFSGCNGTQFLVPCATGFSDTFSVHGLTGEAKLETCVTGAKIWNINEATDDEGWAKKLSRYIGGRRQYSCGEGHRCIRPKNNVNGHAQSLREWTVSGSIFGTMDVVPQVNEKFDGEYCGAMVVEGGHVGHLSSERFSTGKTKSYVAVVQQMKAQGQRVSTDTQSEAIWCILNLRILVYCRLVGLTWRGVHRFQRLSHRAVISATLLESVIVAPCVWRTSNILEMNYVIS